MRVTDDMENVYREYSKTVYRYLLTLTKDENAAEEMTQETFFRAVKTQIASTEAQASQPGFAQSQKTSFSAKQEKEKNAPSFFRLRPISPKPPKALLPKARLSRDSEESNSFALFIE